MKIKTRTRLKFLYYKALSRVTGRRFVIYDDGTVLIPGNGGKKCRYNGSFRDGSGNLVECCCDECDFFAECFGADDGSAPE